MPGDDERFQVCDQSRSRHSVMITEEMSVMNWMMEVVGAVLLVVVYDGLITWFGTGKLSEMFILWPLRAWNKSQKKKGLVMMVNTVGRQLKTSCINQIREQAGEQVEKPNIYFGERFPDVDWDTAVRQLKVGWAALRNSTKTEFPSLSLVTDMPHFDQLKPLLSCTQERDVGVIRSKPLQR